ncbi:LLM class flavin-dependent oxidoreductase [Nocardiopsis ansamitocini]|uniref:Alkanesulfonate monooxygenase n=1 Tax=Nocardiopsis ansamitocini TaxID=1670832 RepID=A0A9W6P245_9ACTN|nr:LLM class flavin-dependent oxidoreductase [Nocardiopsis ansamitocini]GLU45702.1 alkanesulfonate monooxygenase [Nocardiopsis ansamitocini]
MAKEVLWYIVPQDGAYPWEPEGRREVDLAYLQNLARGVDRLGYSGALLATAFHDVWVLGTALADVTTRLRPLVAVHPGLISPVLLAKMALTFDHLFGGRLTINVINGDTRTLSTYGLTLAHDERYALAREYWSVFTRLTAGETVDFHGDHIDVTGAGTGFQQLRPVQKPHVPLWFGGSSEPGLDLAAELIDVYLSWGEPPADLKEKIDRLRAKAAQRGRTLRFGLRVHLIVKDTDAEAWSYADHLLKVTRPETFARQLDLTTNADSVGQNRQLAAHRGRVPDRAKDIESSPNLWPGMGLLRPGPGTALVGSHANVIERLQEFESLGVDTFILSGNPLLEEAHHVAETILPHLGIPTPGHPA